MSILVNILIGYLVLLILCIIVKYYQSIPALLAGAFLITLALVAFYGIGSILRQVIGF